VDGANHQLGDDAEGSLQDLVMRGIGISVPGSANLGEATPTSGSLGTTGPRVFGLLLPGSLALYSYPSIRGEWRALRSSLVRRSPPRRGCCMRRWPWSAETSYVQFGLV
jgi:hypothetical protein